MTNEFTTKDLEEFEIVDEVSMLIHKTCGSESPYVDNMLQAMEWVSGHICRDNVISITEFVNRVKANSKSD